MTELEAFLRRRRPAMVAFAEKLLTRRLGQGQASLADDAVQQATLAHLEALEDGREKGWNERRFVMRVASAALNIADKEGRSHAIKVHNVANGGNPKRGRITDLFPTQIFGRSLNEAISGEDGGLAERRAA